MYHKSKTGIVSNAKVFGLEDSIKASKYPMSVDIESLTDEITPTVVKLATSEKGEGHDNWLNGIVVQFDLTFTVKAWTEMERYHFIDFVSSQSTMHRITKFDLDKAYIEYVDERIIDIMKQKVADYNAWQADIKENKDKYGEEMVAKATEALKKKYLKILYSNPCGMRLTARMTTNYRQLKTIYAQRHNHRLPEWREFCDWCKTLPHNEFILPKMLDK